MPFLFEFTQPPGWSVLMLWLLLWYRSRYDSVLPGACSPIAAVVCTQAPFPVCPTAPVRRVIRAPRPPRLRGLCGPILASLVGPSLAATSAPSSSATSAPCPCHRRDLLTTGVNSRSCYLTRGCIAGGGGMDFIGHLQNFLQVVLAPHRSPSNPYFD